MSRTRSNRRQLLTALGGGVSAAALGAPRFGLASAPGRAFGGRHQGGEATLLIRDDI